MCETVDLVVHVFHYQPDEQGENNQTNNHLDTTTTFKLLAGLMKMHILMQLISIQSHNVFQNNEFSCVGFINRILMTLERFQLTCGIADLNMSMLQ